MKDTETLSRIKNLADEWQFLVDLLSNDAKDTTLNEQRRIRALERAVTFAQCRRELIAILNNEVI